MKKATLGSTAVWAGSATVLIGYQLAGQAWPRIANRAANHIVIVVSICIISASIGLMKDVSPKELLPSPLNTPQRNFLNIANFVAGVIAAFCFGYLAGLFGSVQLRSSAFKLAVALLGVGIAFQLLFAAVTARKELE